MTAGALLLFPGAGTGADHPSLVAIEEALDLPVARADFPYRREGRRAPDRPPKLIAYPLHPPGKPERLRVDHFPAIEVPCLFVSGTRDPFGTPEELEAHTAAIRGPVTHVWVEGARHELKGADEQVAATVRDWLTALQRPTATRRT